LRHLGHSGRRKRTEKFSFWKTRPLNCRHMG
jgi:hypothetical protein